MSTNVMNVCANIVISIAPLSTIIIASRELDVNGWMDQRTADRTADPKTKPFAAYYWQRWLKIVT